jgi:hypothetical protein
MSRHVGIVVIDRGAAIVTVERSDDDRLTCTGIERLPFDLSVVTARVRALIEPEVRYVIDSEGLGQALWTLLRDDVRPRRLWTLYAGKGLERQALVDRLLIAVERDLFRFAADIPEQDAMNRALASYKRQVRDDGVIGSELVVALLLALIPRPSPPMVW